MTEQELFDALAVRYHAPEHALIPQATQGTGWKASRWLDGLAVSLWPSRGITFHGFEIKCARYDWLRELRNPEKGEGLFKHLDFFSVVVASADIVQEGELPAQWGLLVWSDDSKGLSMAKAAPRLHEGDLPRTMSRDFLAGICRRIDEQYVTRKVEKATREAVERAEKDAEDRIRRRLSIHDPESRDKLALAAFAEGMGYAGRVNEHEARRFGQIAGRLHGLDGKYGELPELRKRLKQLDKTLKEIDALLEPQPEEGVA